MPRHKRGTKAIGYLKKRGRKIKSSSFDAAASTNDIQDDIIFPIKCEPVEITSEQTEGGPAASTNDIQDNIIVPIKCEHVEIRSVQAEGCPAASTNDICDNVIYPIKCEPVETTSGQAEGCPAASINDICDNVIFPIKSEPVEITSGQAESDPAASTNDICDNVIFPIKCEPVETTSGQAEGCPVDFEDSEGSSASAFYLESDSNIQMPPTHDAEELYPQHVLSSQQYSTLKKDLWSQSAAILDETGYIMMKSDDIKFVQLYDTRSPGVKSVIRIDPDAFEASVTVHRQILEPSHELWRQVPKLYYSSEGIFTLLREVSAFSVCVGNPDLDFQSLSPGISAFQEPDFGAVCGTMEYNQTIRRKNCDLLVEGLRCQKCMDHRCALRKKKSIRNLRQLNSNDANKTNLFSKRTTHKNMSREMLCEKVLALQKERYYYSTSAEIQSLRKKLKKAIEMSLQVTEKTNDDLNKMIVECQPDVLTDYPYQNSFQRLFWDEQIKYNKCKQPSLMRWHPMIIKWCLLIKGRASKEYETLGNIGSVKLPSSRTLFNYSHILQAKCGTSVETQNHLFAECKAKGMIDTEWMSYVGLLQDEIKIQEDLVYDKQGEELIGFTDLDKTRNQLIELEQALDGSSQQLAKSVLVVMVRGITTDLKYPLACYSATGITADFLYLIIYKAIRILEIHVGLKVLFVTCDGASSYRKFFSMHGKDNANWTINPYDSKRKIFFIADVPHLIKTCRNCFADSNRFKLWNAGKPISWMHIVDLYNKNVKGELSTCCPKLTEQHIDLDGHSKMNVRLAAQVLSSTVADALEHMFGEEVSETVKFIRNMDKFFDCLNTRNLFEGNDKRNPSLQPYVSLDDERLRWLENDFLQYFDDWESSVTKRPGDFTPQERGAMLLSHQTVSGIKMTVLSVCELVRFLLNRGVPFVLTSVFNQDPLEQQFELCRSPDNSGAFDRRHSINRPSSPVLGSTDLALSSSKTGNTKRVEKDQFVDNAPLCKRPKKMC